MEKYKNLSLMMVVLSLIMFGVLRYTEINPLILSGTIIILSIIGLIFGFLSKRSFPIVFNIIIFLYAIFLMLAFLLAYSNVYDG